MKNKSGQLMSFWLIIITLFMCVTAIGIYSIHLGQLESSIISPTTILEQREEMKLIEIQETYLLLNSSRNLNWDGASFVDDLLTEFLENLKDDEDLLNKIFDNISLDQSPESIDTPEEKISYLRDKGVYTISKEGDVLTFRRKNLKKELELRALKPNKINFATNVILSFEAAMMISREQVEMVSLLDLDTTPEEVEPQTSLFILR